MPDKYGSIALSFRSLFDAMIGTYEYADDSNYAMSSSILTIVHLFLSNIFLMNYLVAILSTVY